MIIKSLYMMKNIGNQKLSQILNTVDFEAEASICKVDDETSCLVRIFAIL